MLRFQRPKPPPGFAREVEQAACATRKAIAAGERPELPELWSKHKRAFSAAQHGKCGYCETFALNHPSAVDHFAPKRSVHILVSDGVELDELANVRARETREISGTGYYWIAYDWNNWLLACERCNTRWKGSLFPVHEDPHPCPPHPRRRYTALLLNPYGPADPLDHLDFNSLGQIFPLSGSARGEATIRTCGLDRESLRRARAGIAADAIRHVSRLEKALAEDHHVVAHHAATDLLQLGSGDRPHAGMVRSLVRSRLKLSYRELDALIKEIAALELPAGKKTMLSR
ncbi:MAG: hypothetical protein ABJE95_24325 [Byssovorax sp.]